MRSETIGLGLLLTGILALISVRLLNDRHDWILGSLELPLASMESRTQELKPHIDGYAEIQIEVDASIPLDLRNTYIYPTDVQSEFNIRWEIHNDDRIVAAGDAKNYLYIAGMPSLLGRIRRIVMQVPFGRDQAHWNSFGLAGSRTIGRGIGRFLLDADEQYAVHVTAQGDHSDLRSSAPTLVLRVERRVWQRHYERVRILGYLGLVFIAVGGPLAVLGRLRRERPSPRP
ncbi:MAG: hypothetical protein KJO95_12205 [Gammaproteobacteria bacterium]|nr:hypothetical protein [Gammaproteobacteria bacterium]NNC58212.1 hypothetical protein [Woeseiaceae bacterium]